MTDFVGIAVHCAQGRGSICAHNPGARPDLLPEEPGGYRGYQALFGAKYVNPAINDGSPSVPDVYGTTPITDGFGQPGFPGFDAMSAEVTLGCVASMQEAGIPVTYAYISDAHDDHAGGGGYGPGEAAYVAALQSYDDAFAEFLDRLAADDIDESNTLFIVTADENDHFAGGEDRVWSRGRPSADPELAPRNCRVERPTKGDETPKNHWSAPRGNVTGHG